MPSGVPLYASLDVVLGVEIILLTRDFLEDDRGVTLLPSRNALTGVDKSAFEPGVTLPDAALFAAERWESGVLGDAALAANLGVKGDFARRFAARVGINGRPAVLALGFSEGMLSCYEAVS